MVSAFGGIHAHVFLHMDQAERRAVLDGLIGREIRCVVGGNGAGGNYTESKDRRGSETNKGFAFGWSCSSRVSGVEYRIERIAGANPAADLAYILSSM